MTENELDPQADQLREALRELRENTPSNQLARASLMAAVAGVPGLEQVAMEELAYPQAELDLHLDGESVTDHSTRADWLGHFVARLSAAVNEVTKSITHKKRLTPGLRVLAPARGSVRLVLRAPADTHPTDEKISGADDTSAESRALGLVTALLKLSEEEAGFREESPLTAAAQTLTPRARQRVRAVARSVMDAQWEVSGTLAQKGKTLETVQVTAGSAKRLYDELNREVVNRSHEVLQGTIDGQRHSLSTMWFVPDGAARPVEVAVTDLDLLERVTRLSAQPDLRVECHFQVFLTTPAGASEASSRSRELEAIEPVTPDDTLID